jgi:hypothetical protein
MLINNLSLVAQRRTKRSVLTACSDLSESEASNLWLCKLPGYTDVSWSLH